MSQEFAIDINQGCSACSDNCHKGFEIFLQGLALILIYIRLLAVGIGGIFGVAIIASVTENERIGWAPITLFVVWLIFNGIFEGLTWYNFLCDKHFQIGDEGRAEKQTDRACILGHRQIRKRYPCVEVILYVFYWGNIIVSMTIAGLIIRFLVNHGPLETPEKLAEFEKPFIYMLCFTFAYYFFIYLSIGSYYLITLSVISSNVVDNKTKINNKSIDWVATEAGYGTLA